jgi:hypothetical protein
MKNVLGDIVHDEIKGLEEKMTKVNENINYQLNDQKDKFEAMKKKKLERIHSPNKSNNYLKYYLVRIKSYLAKNKQPNSVNNVPENSLNYEDDKISLYSELVGGQSTMLKEIEDYIEKNMNEMHLALEELKISFEDEINSLDGK